MKFITSILLTALASFAAGLVLPWWSIAFAAFLVALLIHQKAGIAFLSGLLGVFLLWGLLAFWIDLDNDGVLSAKIAEVLPLGGSRVLLILVTGLVGGLVAGFAALSGAYMIKKSRS